MSTAAALVHVGQPGVDAVGDAGRVGRDLEHVAVVEDVDAVLADADGLGQLGVGALVAGLAVDRREDVRPQQLQHEQQVAGAAVARDVHAGVLALGDELRRRPGRGG